MNAPECFGGELALSQLPKTIDGDEWGGRIKRCVDEDLVSGFLVSRPSDDESDLARLHRVQPKICWFVSIVHVVEVVHILEGHSENAVAGEIDRRSVRGSRFDPLGNNLAAIWFLWERDAGLYVDNQKLKKLGHSSL